MNVSRIFVALCGLVVLVFVASCGKGEDRYDRVGLYEGKAESQLRREVGPPSREQPITADERGMYCDAADAERVLFYDVPSRGTGKRLRDMLGINPAHSNIVCVNRAGQVVEVDILIVD